MANSIKEGASRLPLFIIITFVCLLGASCRRHYAIEDRARAQIYVSMEDELQGFCPGMYNWRIDDLKTVYVNDSICMLQCTARFRDAEGNKRIRDYRYIYLIDTQMSRIYRRPIFKEQFRNILCMPDDLIRECRKEVKWKKESVYENSIASCIEVHKPFD